MTYVLAWLTIGFVCALLSYSYNTEAVYKYKIKEYLTRNNGKELPDELNYSTYRTLTFVMITIYGVFGIFSYYSIRHAYFKTL